MRKIDELRFGTAGIPLCTNPADTINGLMQVRRLDLDVMELEFVRNIYVSAENAPEVKKASEKANVLLTCHGQYAVNLASPEKIKIEASMKRMIDAATRAHECGAWSIVWHAAYFQGRPKDTVHEIVKKNMGHVVKTLHDNGVRGIWLRTETTGKDTQWGDLHECIRLAQEIEGVLPCVDFSHLHSRYGKNNTTVEFRKILEDIEKGLGKEALSNMHIHLSGINYGSKGEKNHLILKESDMNYRDLLKVWKEFKIKGAVICESPNIEGDAMILKKFYSAI